MAKPLDTAGTPRETPALSNERFGFTLFVSICFHVVLILGVGFGIYEQFSEQPSMEITLAQYRSDEAPENPDFLAQGNQSGSGNQDQRAAPSSPAQAPFSSDTIQDVSPLQQQQSRRELQQTPQESLLATDASARQQVNQQPESENTVTEADPGEENLNEQELSETIASLQAQLDLQRQAYAKRPRKYTISSASTQKARDALYLDGWRKKIEAIGNTNYPEQASAQGIYGNLRMLVALRPDGSVSEI
ncbi:MAG: energy transducer TonB, partial [Pseudohongiellaceae bacterium]